MSETLRRVQTLVLAGDVHVSEHAFEELEKDAILLADIIEGIPAAVAIEDYVYRDRGPSVLVLQQDGDGQPVHVVWALPKLDRRPAVIVTAYRPKLHLWDETFTRRKKNR